MELADILRPSLGSAGMWSHAMLLSTAPPPPSPPPTSSHLLSQRAMSWTYHPHPACQVTCWIAVQSVSRSLQRQLPGQPDVTRCHLVSSGLLLAFYSMAQTQTAPARLLVPSQQTRGPHRLPSTARIITTRYVLREPRPLKPRNNTPQQSHLLSCSCSPDSGEILPVCKPHA